MTKQSLRAWDGRTKSIGFWWVTVFGVGMLKPAPGTWGSAVGAIIGYFMLRSGMNILDLIVCAAALTVLSSWLINNIEQATGFHDAPEIVVDEVAGQWLAFLPLVGMASSPLLFLLAFGLFRLFDILKPWPIRWLDIHVDGGFGVMVDDLLAGVFAAIVIWTLLALDLLDWFIQ